MRTPDPEDQAAPASCEAMSPSAEMALEGQAVREGSPEPVQDELCIPPEWLEPEAHPSQPVQEPRGGTLEGSLGDFFNPLEDPLGVPGMPLAPFDLSEIDPSNGPFDISNRNTGAPDGASSLFGDFAMFLGSAAFMNSPAAGLSSGADGEQDHDLSRFLADSVSGLDSFRFPCAAGGGRPFSPAPVGEGFLDPNYWEAQG